MFPPCLSQLMSLTSSAPILCTSSTSNKLGPKSSTSPTFSTKCCSDPSVIPFSTPPTSLPTAADASVVSGTPAPIPPFVAAASTKYAATSRCDPADPPINASAFLPSTYAASSLVCTISSAVGLNTPNGAEPARMTYAPDSDSRGGADAANVDDGAAARALARAGTPTVWGWSLMRPCWAGRCGMERKRRGTDLETVVEVLNMLRGWA
mmetsp:Transcript_5818/g.14160  ORF Transcript_5818/g.14160 Transcript_5818/m.14160 type:complete len:208 (-) Transcript_5818:23-646(-)